MTTHARKVLVYWKVCINAVNRIFPPACICQCIVCTVLSIRHVGYEVRVDGHFVRGPPAKSEQSYIVVAILDPIFLQQPDWEKLEGCISC